MLVLLSFVLVLVATVLLVLGLMSDGGLGFIYASIACSVGAAVVLVIAVRMARPKHEAATAPEPLPAPEPEREPELAAVSSGAGAATATTPAIERDHEQSTAAPGSQEWLASDQDDWGGDDDTWLGDSEVEFPIADYDDLTSTQILPLLPQLYADELDVVEGRERATKSRPDILARLAELRGEEGTPEAPPEAPPAPAATPRPAAAPAAPLVESDSSWADEEWFPIEDYDALTVAQIAPLLPELDPDELEVVREREVAGANRDEIVGEIDRRLGRAPAAPATARSTARPASRRPAATKSATRSTKRAPAKRAATRATKKAAAKKSAATKRAPAKKAAKRAAPAKKAVRKATPAKKAARSTKKAAAKKAAKKSTKKATKRRSG